MIVVDDFLPEFKELQEYAKTATFTDVVNEADGVTYPLICAGIPSHIKFAIYSALETHFCAPVSPTIFLRRSPAGVPCPHQVHSDASMGTHSLMLYLNSEEYCRGGTSFLSHRATGIAYNPEGPEATAVIVAAQNRPESWDVREMAEMRPNRAVIFDASRLHRAEPVGGFGDTPENTRVVLTCFFRRG
jgi:hypothetical protein